MNVFDFHDRQITGVKLNDKWGLINQNDSIILLFDYDDIKNYRGTNIFFMKHEGRLRLG